MQCKINFVEVFMYRSPMFLVGIQLFLAMMDAQMSLLGMTWNFYFT